MPAAAWLIAHQGGWDEMLFVAIPIAIFAWLLRMANKRAEANLPHQDPTAGRIEHDEDGDHPEPSGPPDRDTPPATPPTG